MTFSKQAKKWPWRDYLTEDEASNVLFWERRSEELKSQLAVVTASLAPIRNRAIQRAKHEARKEAIK